ncbi:hypothetical protein BG004_003167, partial [Podila humilis]
VRIRAVEFLAVVWEHCVALDEREDYRARATKRLKDSVVAATDRDRDQEQDLDAKVVGSRPPNWWFYDIKGDKILIEATVDASRMVRLSTVETLKKIKASLDQRVASGALVITHEEPTNDDKHRDDDDGGNAHDREQGGKRKDTSTATSATGSSSAAQNHHPHSGFYRELCRLDFERLDATTSVEQLYQEVLDVEKVEPVVMAESEQANDGNNVLDCY